MKIGVIQIKGKNVTRLRSIFGLVRTIHMDSQMRVTKHFLSGKSAFNRRFFYSGFVYDANGNITQFVTFISKSEAGFDTKWQNRKMHMEYENGEIVSYKDQDGNHWEKRWGVPFPFESKLMFMNKILSTAIERKDLLMTEV